jgi:hypothetical protein
MSKNPKRVLGDGAKGDVDEVENGESTVQPGLVDTDEKAGATLTEQAAADLRAEQRAAKAADNDKKEND